MRCYFLNFRRKNIKKPDNFQINQTYKKTCYLLQKTRFSLNITDCIEIGQKENLHEVPNKPWSANGLDKLIKKIGDTGVQTVLMVMVDLNH